MRRLLLIVVMLLSGGNAGLAQVSTLGTTAMGLPSTPGTMLSSPLNGPSPFSAVTQPGTPDTTLAPVPLASDPTPPGTVVLCSTPSGQIAPATPTVTSTFTDVTGGTTPSTSATPPGAISVPGVVSTTGTTSPASAPGSSSSTVCSSTPGGPPTNGAALPLSTPQIVVNPPLGAIQSGVPDLGSTSLDQTASVMPTPNTSACAESITMDLARPGMMTPANSTGAPATPGVSAPPSPAGC
jgi:hypothetical protein